MASSIDRVIDEIANIAHVLVEDARLRDWFLSLEHLSPSARNMAFGEMASRMTAARERPAMIAAVSALASRDIYAAVRDRVRELCEADRFTFPTFRTTLLVASFLGLASLGVYFLVRDQSPSLTRYFWPGVTCLFAAMGIFVSWLVTSLMPKIQRTRHSP